MARSRSRGLGLMLIGALCFLGTTAEVLPIESFCAGVAASLVGCIVFMKGNRAATQRAERRRARALNPVIRNEAMERHAEQQERQLDEQARRRQAGLRVRPEPMAAATPARDPLAMDELVLYEVDDADGRVDEENPDFKVTTDVSFPIEVQEHDSLAEQLEKLKRLQEGGVISAEEFAIAKSKLLR
ncbi:MAG: SHOCT domain-containing protein [Proteobacteria bacterium]|nr:SHOCT domain-containing protein [Pseudomonadota bacterium]